MVLNLKTSSVETREQRLGTIRAATARGDIAPRRLASYLELRAALDAAAKPG